MSNGKTEVIKDFSEKSVLIKRSFKAPLSLVWRAYTEAEILDKWWGPSPWRAETKHLDFRAGGHWLYAMIGPEGEKHWGRMNYTAIYPQTKIELEDAFCDENGVMNEQLPVSRGSFNFAADGAFTHVEFKMYYSSEEQLRMIVEMGFEQGITICLAQLETLLEQHSSIQ